MTFEERLNTLEKKFDELSVRNKKIDELSTTCRMVDEMLVLVKSVWDPLLPGSRYISDVIVPAVARYC